MKDASLPHNIGNHTQQRLPVTKRSKSEYIKDIRPRYLAGTKHEKNNLLAEILTVCKYNRKYCIRLLNKKPPARYPKALYAEVPKRSGRPKIYDAPEILGFLCALWHASHQACGKRLKSVLPLWLVHYEAFTDITLSSQHQALLLIMSAATIDRLLASERRKYRVGTGRATTKPGTMLKNRIPVKTEQWDETIPGFMEFDTVGHCGISTAGEFVHTLNSVDIASTWVEPRAIWGKGQTGVVGALKSIEDALPFSLRGADVDNGTEVLNLHVERYLTGRKHPVEYTRSREYKKNDNAHIEGRNWTHIRQYFGYQRFNNPAVVDLMNDLYQHEYSSLVNYFLPSVKLVKKERIGAKIIKHHDKPMTPCDRLLASPHISKRIKQQLRERRQSFNPFVLYKMINQKIRAIFRICTLPAEVVSPRRTSTGTYINRVKVISQQSLTKHQETRNRASHRKRNSSK